MNWRKSLIFLGLRLTGNPTIKYLDEIRFLSNSSSANIEIEQSEKLENLLLHAYNNIPYYHKVLQYVEVVKNGRVLLENFEKIPILTKELIRNNFEDLKSKDVNKRKWYYNASGGSTGKPLRIIQDKKYNDWNNAVKLFYMEMVGKEIGVKELKLWGSERDILEGSIGFSAKITNFFYNRKLLNSFRMTNNDMHDYIKSLNQFKPKQIWTYIESIYELAMFVETNKMSVYSPKSIIVTAGTLNEDVRAYIEGVFRCKVINQYGSREVGSIACECSKQEGLHIFENFNKIEIMDNDNNPLNDGKNGKIIVTNLANYSMPLIRYEIGDTGTMSEIMCSCGRGLKMLKAVTGRITDHFLRKDGTIIHGEYFTHLFYFKDWIKKFQVIQKEYNLIELKIVLNGEKNERDITQIKKDICVVMGKDCKIKFNYVDTIEESASGKYRYTISEVK